MLLLHSLAELERLETLLLAQRIALRQQQIFTHHFRHQLREARPGLPAELELRRRWITQQRIYFSGAEIARVDTDDDLAGMQAGHRALDLGDNAGLMHAESFPLERDADLLCRGVDEVAH